MVSRTGLHASVVKNDFKNENQVRFIQYLGLFNELDIFRVFKIILYNN